MNQSKAKKPRCVFCGRAARAAIEEIKTGHRTPVCWAHQRLAVAGSQGPEYEFVKLEIPTPTRGTQKRVADTEKTSPQPVKSRTGA